MPASPANPEPAAVGFGEAFHFWLKLGFISFGGPAGQIAIMHQELVDKRRWISEKRFLHALNYCMLLPGPEAQQLATYIGWLMHRSTGGIVAGALFVLPSLAILIVLSWLYLAFGNSPLTAGLLYGVKPAVTAVVLFAAYRIGSRILRHPVLWAVAGLSFIALFGFDVPFPLIIAAAAAIGLAGSRLAPSWFVAKGHSGSTASDAIARAIIDDHTPAPAHARFDKMRFIGMLATGLALWAAAMAVLVSAFGVHGTYAAMGWFFTKAALLTFGGAYAVLPYVVQGAVDQHHWLTMAQMIDGLALGETTPGPLIMVVAFVAFVGGWTQAALGPDHLAAAGVTAAIVATYFTFLPSFLFILLGGPLVEGTRGLDKLAAPLAAITAAVVGVIATLAVFFASHVFWPAGFGGTFEWPLAAIGVVAFAALLRYRAGVIPVIFASALAGLLFQSVAA